MMDKRANKSNGLPAARIMSEKAWVAQSPGREKSVRTLTEPVTWRMGLVIWAAAAPADSVYFPFRTNGMPIGRRPQVPKLPELFKSGSQPGTCSEGYDKMTDDVEMSDDENLDFS